MIYVSVRQMFIRDRVAPVSNRVAEVVNGEPLKVLQHERRFYKVQTPKNQIGWIDDEAVIDDTVYSAFVKLAADHKGDPAVATATLRDELYMHVLPGRGTNHFYLLPANTRVQLLARASVSRTPPSASPAAAAPSPAVPHRNVLPVPGLPEPEPVVMEDWWLARDPQGRTGWLLGSRLDVVAPDDIAQYAEGQRIVGAYVLTRVTDPDSNFPNHEAPEYVTVTAPYESGLPYDFNEVRVFTWSLRHHRYETAFRLRDIEGFLPVRTGFQPGPDSSYQQVPVFSFEIATGPNVTTDPNTGITRPVGPRTIRYEMLDTVVKRVGPDLAPLPSTREGEHKPNEEKHKREPARSGKRRR